MTNERIPTAAADEATTASTGPATGSATDLLDTIMAAVGVDGLCAALAEPGLQATVDQHAAAVREAIRHAGHQVTAASLAGYARSIVAAAHRMGLWLPRPGEATMPELNWHRAPWHLLRLVAVCALADGRALLLPS
jgi:hypothetical protein